MYKIKYAKYTLNNNVYTAQHFQEDVYSKS